jgi:hypothetical protein
LSPRARDIGLPLATGAHCEALGPAGNSGASGESGNGGSGGSGGSANDGDAPENDGCQVPAGLGSSSNTLPAGLLVGLGALVSLLRRSKKAAGCVQMRSRRDGTRWHKAARTALALGLEGASVRGLRARPLAA